MVGTIPTILTGGLGNGTFAGSSSLIMTMGYGISEAIPDVESEIEPMDFTYHPNRTARSTINQRFYRGSGPPFRFVCSDQDLVIDITDYEVRVGRGEGFPLYITYSGLLGTLTLDGGSLCDIVCDPTAEETEEWPLTGKVFVQLVRIGQASINADIRLEMLPVLGTL